MTVAATDVDPEAAIDRLVEAGIVHEDDDGTLRRSESFQRTQAVYHDTYAALGSDPLAESIVEVFGVSEAEATRRVEAGEVTHQDLVAYLALQSDLEPTPDQATLAVMSDIVTQLGSASPVPQGVEEVTDETVEAFLADNPDAVVTVWKRFCDPCDEMKAEFDEILAEIPDGVAVAGLEGEECPAFVNRYEVTGAPALVAFRDGDHERTATGRREPRGVADIVEETFGR